MLDRILEVDHGDRLVAVRRLRAEEEYLRDHFPRFPVMPGVLMLETMFQTAMWLVRYREDFAHSVVLLAEARNIKYADFVQPGQTLVVEATMVRQDDRTSLLRTTGTVEDRTAVSGRLVLERFNLADQHPERSPMDQYIRRKFREEFQAIYRPDVSAVHVPAEI